MWDTRNGNRYFSFFGTFALPALTFAFSRFKPPTLSQEPFLPCPNKTRGRCQGCQENQGMVAENISEKEVLIILL